ncbi:MAG TPA: DNA-directed RNA polymerase subunit delta [Bacilli bacterium]
MSSQNALKISEEQAREMPMVDLAFMILKQANSPMYYRDLMQEIAKIKGISDSEVNRVIAQLYTEINIDGRFACVGANLWGLKRWYPVDKTDDAMGGSARPRIINDDDDDLDDEDIYEEEEAYEQDDEDFDSIVEDDEADIYEDEDADEDLGDLDEDLDEGLDDEISEDEDVVNDDEDVDLDEDFAADADEDYDEDK